MSTGNGDILSTRYANEQHGISLRHPADWDVVFEDESEGMWYQLVCMAEPPDPAGRAGLTLQIGPLSEGGTVKSYMQKAESDLRGLFADFTLILADEREVLGWPAAWMEYRYSGDVGPMQELNVTVFLGKTRVVPLQFICESPRTKYARWLPAFEQIINSTEITSKGLRLPQVVLVGGQSCGRCGRALSDDEDVDAVMDPEIGDVIPICGACQGSSVVRNDGGQEQSSVNSSDEGRELCARAAELRKEWQDEENLVKAEELFRQAVVQFPDLWASHFGLGEILLLKAGRSQISSGPPLDEGREHLKKAAALDPAQPEPLLKLANTFAGTDAATAERFYKQGLQALDNQAEGLYSVNWQSGDHWAFAIGAAESGRDTIATDAFCRAIEMNDDYAGTYMPSPPRANAVWQSALRKLGRTEWFDQQKGQEDLFGDLFSASAKKWWQFWK